MMLRSYGLAEVLISEDAAYIISEKHSLDPENMIAYGSLAAGQALGRVCARCASKRGEKEHNEGRVSRNMLTLESGRKIREVPVGMFY